MSDKLDELYTSMEKTVFKGQKFSDLNKRNVRNGIHSKKTRTVWVPNFLTLLISCGFIAALVYFIGDEMNLFHQTAQQEVITTITDVNTKAEVESVIPPENSLLIEWDSDSMDRGNHDYQTFFHSELVVDVDYSSIERGDVIYFKSPDFTIESNPFFKMPDHYISRVVALPGETIEIKDGQVWIDHKKLDTFYSKLLMNGMNEKEYFERVNPVNRGNEDTDREYFTTTMAAVKLDNNSVFVLADNGWRGVDSSHFGPLSLESVMGEVLGYKNIHAKD